MSVRYRTRAKLQASRASGGTNEAPLGRARGSQPGAQAGRRTGWARNGDWFKIAARAEKGVRNLLCEAPLGPFRQKVPDPFSGPKISAFRGRIRANLRPDGRAQRKNRRKSAKKWREMAINGAFSGVSSAISACSEPTALDRKPPACQTLRLWNPAASRRLRPRQSPMERHFSQNGAWTDKCKTVAISRLR